MNARAIVEKLATPRWSPRAYKATLGAIILVAIAVPIALVAGPFSEFLNGMAAQPKGKAQMTYGRTHDAKGFGWPVERKPVEGTVPRGYQPYAYQATGIDPKHADAVGKVHANPLPVTVENMKRGQKMYAVNCAMCHGARGHGDGPVVGSNRFPPPPSFHSDRARSMADGAMFHVITKGTRIMPSAADKLDPTERWQVILFLRALQRSENPKGGARR